MATTSFLFSAAVRTASEKITSHVQVAEKEKEKGKGEQLMNWQVFTILSIQFWLFMSGGLVGLPYSGKIWRVKNLANCFRSRKNQNLAKF